jgi:Ca2+-binding RTX toxin-like protein
MRRVVLLLTAMAVTLVVASGVALAVNRIGTDGPNTLRGTNGNDNLLGKGGNDDVRGGGGSDYTVGGRGNDFLNESPREASVDNYVGGPGGDVFAVNNRPAATDVVACGSGFDRVLADRKDVVAGDCERVYFGLTDEEFGEIIGSSFFEGLPPPPEG